MKKDKENEEKKERILKMNKLRKSFMHTSKYFD
jgi:hypothetical protein